MSEHCESMTRDSPKVVDMSPEDVLLTNDLTLMDSMSAFEVGISSNVHDIPFIPTPDRGTEDGQWYAARGRGRSPCIRCSDAVATRRAMLDIG